MMRVIVNLKLFVPVFAVALALTLAGCKDSSQSAQSLGTAAPEFETVVLTQVVITDYVVVSTRRVGRTVTEYTLRAIATNNSATRYTNVTASLISVPAHITVVDGIAVAGWRRLAGTPFRRRHQRVCHSGSSVQAEGKKSAIIASFHNQTSLCFTACETPSVLRL